MRLFYAICTVWILCVITYATYELVQPTSCDNDYDEQLREYQIQLEMDEALIFDGNRFVGRLPFDETQRFDSLMIADNK